MPTARLRCTGAYSARASATDCPLHYPLAFAYLPEPWRGRVIVLVLAIVL